MGFVNVYATLVHDRSLSIRIDRRVQRGRDWYGFMSVPESQWQDRCRSLGLAHVALMPKSPQVKRSGMDGGSIWMMCVEPVRWLPQER